MGVKWGHGYVPCIKTLPYSRALTLAPIFSSPAQAGCPIPSHEGQPAPAPLGSTKCLLPCSHSETSPHWRQAGLCFTSAFSLTSGPVNYLLSSLTSSMKLPQTNTNSSDYSLSVNSTQSCTVGHNSLAWTASFKLSQTLLKTIIYIFSVLLYWSIKKQLDTALMKGSLVIWIKKLNISSALWPQLYL